MKRIKEMKIKMHKEEYKELKDAGKEKEFEGDFWAEVAFGGFKRVK